ncbi:hypothetical protein NSA24_13940, partial [Clostridioides mangenotii]|uniref:hypothetical protein n=1 Tax=Metaclostridioides mangenotii TaxID=1540 RepID=UPI002149FE98
FIFLIQKYIYVFIKNSNKKFVNVCRLNFSQRDNVNIINYIAPPIYTMLIPVDFKIRLQSKKRVKPHLCAD